MEKIHSKKITKNYFETLSWEKSLYTCGIDEVGRGCLAGSVVTCACILPPNTKYNLLKDSKILTVKERNTAYKWIVENCFCSIAISSHKIIDQFNIYQATLKTMHKSFIQLIQVLPFAYEKLKYVVIDAMPLKINPYYKHENLEVFYFNYGETKSSSIAAASIVAKVTRDKLMQNISSSFPGFSLNQHKGYATPKHIVAVLENGASIIHRKTFLVKIKRENSNETKQQSLF